MMSSLIYWILFAVVVLSVGYVRDEGGVGGGGVVNSKKESNGLMVVSCTSGSVME